jgi:hypothetical protein
VDALVYLAGAVHLRRVEDPHVSAIGSRPLAPAAPE